MVGGGQRSVEATHFCVQSALPIPTQIPLEIKKKVKRGQGWGWSEDGAVGGAS